MEGREVVAIQSQNFPRYDSKKLDNLGLYNLVGGFHLNNMLSQIESFPQVGVKIKNIRNHHLVIPSSWMHKTWRFEDDPLISLRKKNHDSPLHFFKKNGHMILGRISHISPFQITCVLVEVISNPNPLWQNQCVLSLPGPRKGRQMDGKGCH